MDESSSEPLDINSFRRRVEELRELHLNSNGGTEVITVETERLLNESASELDSKINHILENTSKFASIASEEFDEFLEHLKKDLTSIENENTKIAEEIEELFKKSINDSSNLEGELEGLDYTLNFIENGSANSNSLITHEDSNFKVFELNHQIEKSKTTLKTLQDLDSNLKRFDLIEKIENSLSGLKVIEFNKNCIRLSLTTYIQRIEGIIDPLEQNHELLIEVFDNSMEPKNIEIFPNDIYISEIFNATKSLRFDTKSSLAWLVQKIQDQITQTTIRRFVVKNANKSRHSFEYLEREEMIIAHMIGEIDAYIKVSQGWPIDNSGLNLTSLKNSNNNNSKEISLSFLCKVKEMANSLGPHIRMNISSFVEGIEDILVKQMSTSL